jgi:hypothetical protein
MSERSERARAAASARSSPWPYWCLTGPCDLLGQLEQLLLTVLGEPSEDLESQVGGHPAAGHHDPLGLPDDSACVDRGLQPCLDQGGLQRHCCLRPKVPGRGPPAGRVQVGGTVDGQGGCRAGSREADDEEIDPAGVDLWHPDGWRGVVLTNPARQRDGDCNATTSGARDWCTSRGRRLCRHPLKRQQHERRWGAPASVRAPDAEQRRHETSSFGRSRRLLGAMTGGAVRPAVPGSRRRRTRRRRRRRRPARTTRPARTAGSGTS